MDEISDIISKYGFPLVMAIGMAIIIYHVWEWCTREVNIVLTDADIVLTALKDRIRMLDNDLIRLNQKVTTVLNIRGTSFENDQASETLINQRIDRADHVNKTMTTDDKDAASGDS